MRWNWWTRPTFRPTLPSKPAEPGSLRHYQEKFHVKLAADWEADWIGAPPPAPDASAFADEASQPSVAECQWIWLDQGDPLEEADAGIAHFRHVFVVPDDCRVLSAWGADFC